MRVHLGSDHAGLELKDHLITWLVDHGYEAVDHGPFVYDALDDYPASASGRRGRRRRPGRGPRQPRRRHRRLGQRRADRGQQGEGIRCALAWSEETAVAGPRAQRRQRGLRRRPDALGRRHDPLRRGLPHHARSPATSATCAASASSPSTTRPASCRRCRSRPCAGLPRRHARMPEGHTLRRLADDLDRRVRRAHRPRLLAAGPLRRRRRAARRRDRRRRGLRRQAPLRRARARALRPRPPRPDRLVRRAHRASTRCPPRWVPVRLRLVTVPGPDPRGTAYADLRGAILCDLVGPARRDEILGRLGPDPLRADADPDLAWRRISRSPRADRRPADGPEGAGRASATSTAPRCSSGTASTRCARATRCGSASGGRSGPTSSS